MNKMTRTMESFLAQADSGVSYRVLRIVLQTYVLNDGRVVLDNDDGTFTIAETGEILTRR